MKTAQQLSSKKRLSSIMIVGAFTVATVATLALGTKSVLAQKTTSQPTPDQTQMSITAIPPRLGEDNSLKALPGEKLQVQLRVRNLSNNTANIVTTAQDFILSEDGETPISIDDSTSNRWSLASWLTITPTENLVEPKQTIGINILIDVPEDALPGGHYAMILHQPNKATGDFEIEGNSQSSVKQRVGTLLYVVVDGPINEEAYIRNFTFPKFTEYGPINFSYTVENNSDIHITPQMNVEIFNIFNQKVDDIKISPKNVFPLTSRDFNGEWRRIWGFGPYNAKLTMSFGTNGSIVVANKMFWLLPIKIVIAVLVGLLIVIITTLSVKRHLNHRADANKKKILDLENKIQEMSSGDTPQL